MIVFYVYMLIVSFLVPACMLIFGYRWKKNPPEKINYSYGYRTKRSMSCENAWMFAHKYCGNICVKYGWFTAVVTALVMAVLPLFALEITIVSVVTLIVVVLQLVPLCVPLILTERALKQEFGI